MITKVFVSAAITLTAAIGLAAPASADPTAFGVLSCGCQQTAPTDSAIFADDVKQGLHQGLFDREPGITADPDPASG